MLRHVRFAAAVVMGAALFAAIGMASAPRAMAADAPILIRFSHVAAPQAHKSRGAVRFKELAETYTNGRVKIALYPNSQLFKDKEELEALQLGAVEMLAPSLSKFAPLGIRAFEAFDLPYMFRDEADIAKVTEGPIGRELLDKLEAKGIVGLGFWNNGFKILSANRPIISPDDVLGLKMRIQSSRVIEEQMTTLGALPQMLAFSEAYQALSSGVVDGTENPPSNMYNQRMYEVQRHATITNHGYLGYAVIMSKSFWDKLPADIREALQRAMRDATPDANRWALEENRDAMDAMLKSGRTLFHTPSPEEAAHWRATLRPVHDAMASRVGPDLIARIKSATGFEP